MGFDVLCIAETCCDIIFGGLEKMPVPGGEEYCREFAVKAGGGSNTAMGLARLGLHTRLLTQLGRDALGESVYRFIEETGVDMAAVRYEEGIETGVSAVLSVPGERGFASYGGSRFQIPEELLESQIRQCRHVHTYLGYCMAFPIGELCERYGKTLSLDVAGGDTASLEQAPPFLSRSAVITPNDAEACRLTGAGSVEEALRILSGYCENVVVTCGEKGCEAFSRGRRFHAGPVKAPSVKDATGAGDLFCAGYLYGYLKGWDPQRRMEYANRAGALAVSYIGGIGEAFTKENVERMGRDAV